MPADWSSRGAGDENAFATRPCPRGIALALSAGVFIDTTTTGARSHDAVRDAGTSVKPPARRRTIVVVGNGMVGHRFCEQLCAHDVGRRFRIVSFGEERRPAYDRVHLSEFFTGRTADDLELAGPTWHAERGMALHLGERVTAIDCAGRTVVSSLGRRVAWDALVLATGSAPFVPAVPGIERPGVFVYRTVEDLEAIAAWGQGARRAAVIGGGLLGLEAARAVRDMGLETHVVEFAPRLMPRQVDARGGEVLRHAIEGLGVHVHLGVQTQEILGAPAVTGLRFAAGEDLAVDMVIVSAGIRPRDELARAAGLAVGSRGGVVVDAALRTSDPNVYCIGESALIGDMIYGLVAPGYDMADVVARRLCGEEATFAGADLSTKLKLLGVDVASFGDGFADETVPGGARGVVFEDRTRGVYQKLVVSEDGRRLLGGILVGDADAYGPLLVTMRAGTDLPARPHELLFGSGGPPADAQICACNNVTERAIHRAIAEHGLTTLGGVKACTRAGTGCGGCLPTLSRLVETALAEAGRAVDHALCEHFAFTRQELFQIVKLGRIASFDALLASHGTGSGCEVCRPAVASILASTWNDFVLNHATVQDTNDRFLANIQRGGTYSVVPRIPGGEITPERLIVLGEIAARFDLYCKITGGQRIDLLGARVDQLPDVWEALVEAGFESGHAYGKAMRTVKSCVGSTWCRYGVQDSTTLAIRLEERYRGIRAPHKLKSAVSGCIRECAEAQSKDFGVIATELGWNLYVGGNGGSKPRHAELLAADVDEATLVRLIDRFVMYYIQTADPLERTARWIERMDGGLASLRRVVVDDALGIAAQLERDMQALVDTYECEWRAVVRDPERRRAFRQAAGGDAAQPSRAFVRERGQRRPADWPAADGLAGPVLEEESAAADWVQVARVEDVPRDGGVTIHHGGVPIAVFRFASRGAWYATQAMCPHRRDMVLGRGLLGTQGDEPKVACPMHKKTFSLETGRGLSDPAYRVQTFPIEERDGVVWVKLPPADRCAAPPRCAASHEAPCAPA
ncbi:MAG: nitrite reductase large subunit NirB [Candidatus Binatia bacterium]